MIFPIETYIEIIACPPAVIRNSTELIQTLPQRQDIVQSPTSQPGLSEWHGPPIACESAHLTRLCVLRSLQFITCTVTCFSGCLFSHSLHVLCCFTFDYKGRGQLTLLIFEVDRQGEGWASLKMWEAAGTVPSSQGQLSLLLRVEVICRCVQVGCGSVPMRNGSF